MNQMEANYATLLAALDRIRYHRGKRATKQQMFDAVCITLSECTPNHGLLLENYHREELKKQVQIVTLEQNLEVRY